MSEPAPSDPVVLFDGVCNLCNGAVQFMIDRDPDARLHFAPLQSEFARALVSRNGGRPDQASDVDTVLLVEDGRVFDRSTAALKIARRLGWPWKAAYAFIIVPFPARDLVYKWVARNRYRWFGTTPVCRIPTADLQSRFLG